MQVGVSAGPECKVVLQEITQLVEQKLASQGNSVKALFGAAEVCFYSYNFSDCFDTCQKLFRCNWMFFLQLEIDGDFFYYLADAAASAVGSLHLLFPVNKFYGCY